MMNLPKGQILRRQEDFLRVRQNGLRFECGPFVFFAGKTGEDTRAPRIGVVTSRKAVGDAVIRNRARRLFKECFRTHPGCLPGGWDAVLVARGNPDRLPFEKLEQRFLRACADAVRKAAGGTGLRAPGIVVKPADTNDAAGTAQ